MVFGELTSKDATPLIPLVDVWHFTAGVEQYGAVKKFGLYVAVIICAFAIIIIVIALLLQQSTSRNASHDDVVVAVMVVVGCQRLLCVFVGSFATISRQHPFAAPSSWLVPLGMVVHPCHVFIHGQHCCNQPTLPIFLSRLNLAASPQLTARARCALNTRRKTHDWKLTNA